MSPPEVWGPAVWSLFHTLAEKINERAYPHLFPSLFNMIVKICKFLPCPECSNDASRFLAHLNISNLKTKQDFKNNFYLFHNFVNAKKRKPLFNYSHMEIYKRYSLIKIVNNFISQYQTKGNMKLLSESFQRQFVIKDFKSWFQKSITAFIPSVDIPNPILQSTNNEQAVQEEQAKEQVVEVKEEIVQEEVKEETVEEEQVVQEEQVVEVKEEIVQEEVKEEIVQEEVKEETVEVKEQVVEVKEQVVEVKEQDVEEQVVEEQVIQEEVKEETVEEQVVEEDTEVTEETVEEQVVQEEETVNDFGVDTDNVYTETKPIKQSKKNKKNKKT